MEKCIYSRSGPTDNKEYKLYARTYDRVRRKQFKKNIFFGCLCKIRETPFRSAGSLTQRLPVKGLPPHRKQRITWYINKSSLPVTTPNEVRRLEREYFDRSLFCSQIGNKSISHNIKTHSS